MEEKYKILPHEQEDILKSILQLFADKGIWCQGEEKLLFLIKNLESIRHMSKERVSVFFDGTQIIHWPYGEEHDEIKEKYTEFFSKRIQKKKQNNREELLGGIILKLKADDATNEYFEKTLQYSQHVYEVFHDKVKSTYLNHRVWLRARDLNPMLHSYKQENKWLYEADSTALQGSIRRIDSEWNSFFKRCNRQKKLPQGERHKLDFPVCLQKSEFTITSPTVQYDGEKLILPKIKKPIETEEIGNSQKGGERISSVRIAKATVGWKAHLYFI